MLIDVTATAACRNNRNSPLLPCSVRAVQIALSKAVAERERAESLRRVAAAEAETQVTYYYNTLDTHSLLSVLQQSANSCSETSSV